MSKLRLGFFLMAAMGLLVATAPRARAQRLACAPSIIAHNNKEIAIKVIRFKYKVAGDNTTWYEALDNKVLAAGEQDKTWRRVTLQHAARGIVITETAVEYKNDNSGSGDGFGAPVWSAWFPHTYTCGDNHTYPHAIE